MSKKIREYPSEGITVSYDANRCIHAAECVHGLPQVFDPEGRPWIDTSKGTPSEIAETVLKCPTGALHFERHDGGDSETAPDRNSVSIAANGPLYLEGDIILSLPDGSALRETRVALCRCGSSQNKPFCDNTHLETKFSDPGWLDVQRRGSGKTEGEEAKLKVRSAPNGPLLLQGPVIITSADGAAYQTETARCVLCRCGESENKPFCDGTHGKVGFQAP